MSLMHRGSVSISSVLTDAGNVVESAAVSQPLNLPAAADMHWQGKGAINEGEFATLPLDGLPLEVFGDDGTICFSAIHEVYVRNTGATSLRVGGWKSLGNVGDQPALFPLAPGAVLLVTSPASGFAVHAGDSISIHSDSAGESGYEILLVGAKA
jgi:hypothetical protein